MSTFARSALLAVAAISLLAAGILNSGLLRPKPAPVLVTAELVAEGRNVYRSRCHPCHTDIPLRQRVTGWTADHAYDVIGRLPQTYRSMPAFAGDDEERRALAAWVSALGKGEVPQY